MRYSAVHDLDRDQATVPSGEQLDALRTMLLEQREFRIDQLAALHSYGTTVVARTVQPIEAMGPADDEIVRTLDSGARAALRDVAAALWRMDDGSYGRCVTCGGPVGVERLEILPQADRCMPCHRAAQPIE